MAVKLPLVNGGFGAQQLQAGDSLSIPWGWVTGEPTTLAGYGITDAAQLSGADLPLTGAFYTSYANGFRITNGNYGAFFRNDGANFYLMFTASGDQLGSWNALRPFTVNLASGLVTIGNGLSCANGIYCSDAVGASATDFSKHIRLHSTGYGWVVTSATLNHNVPGACKHVFNIGGVEQARIDPNGLFVGGDAVGWLGVAYANKTANYTFVAADRDKGAAKNTATAITFTLPTNPTAGDVYPFANINATGNLTIAPGTGGTLRLAGTATTGNRTVAPWGMGSATCVVGGASPVWLCAGAGVT